MIRHLFDDDLLRQLMAVGQVDIVVGLPTLNNADTIARTLAAVSEHLARQFPRARSVIISADRGSSDGTQDLAGLAGAHADSTSRMRGGLRTQHRISASSGAVAGRAGAIRLVFAVADLLQARAVSVLDPDVADMTQDWVASLVGPVWNDSFDLAAPRYERHPLEVPLLSQLARPLLRATFGLQVQEPLIAEFACSGRFAKECLAREFWDEGLGQDAVEMRIVGAALGHSFRVCETWLGARAPVPARQPKRSLREVFLQVVGSLFAGLEDNAASWLQRSGSEPLPLVGSEGPTGTRAPALDPARLGQSFSQDVHDLGPVIEPILAAGTFASLRAVAESGRGDTAFYPDELWVATVFDFLAAHHAGVMGRAHVVEALMPLYLGRVASFVARHANSGPSEVNRAIEQLSERFEQTKPYLVERWNGHNSR